MTALYGRRDDRHYVVKPHLVFDLGGLCVHCIAQTSHSLGPDWGKHHSSKFSMSPLRIILNAAAKNGKRSSRSRTGSLLLHGDTLEYLATALKKQWRRYRKALKRCQEKFSSEAVHDSRVETRRLLAIMGLLSPFLRPQRAKKLQSLLKHHLDTFDDLRDTQVQLQSIGKLKTRFTAAQPFYDYLRKREKRFSHQTRKNIKDFRTKRITRMAAAGREELRERRNKGPAEAANALLWHTLNGAFARTEVLRNQIVPKKPRTIHCTRIAFKKFRYMVEILAAHLPHVDKKRLRAMHAYQTMMGDIQDAVVLLQAWKEYTTECRISGKSAQAFGQELRRRQERFIRAYLTSASRLLEFWPPQETRKPPTRSEAGVSSVSSKRIEVLR
jgi:CHAD domain-containing protein